MDITSRNTEADYTNALHELQKLWGAKLHSKEGDRLQALSLLIEAYEQEHYPIEPLDPIEAIKYDMEENKLFSRGAAVSQRPAKRRQEPGRKNSAENKPFCDDNLAIPI